MLFYLVGIKGSGMSALAKVLLDNNNMIKGVDYLEFYYTEEGLSDVKIDTFESFDYNKDYYYIIGNAFREHESVKYLIENNYKYEYYPNFIANYFKDYIFISICGSHGKTTTTKFISHMISDASYIIGDGSGFGKGTKYFVLESCEYKNTFLSYQPDIEIILNIDYDHPDFFKTESDYVESFKMFSKKAKIVIANGDDKNINKIKDDRFLTFGVNDYNDIKFKYNYIDRLLKINVYNEVFSIPYLGTHYAYDLVASIVLLRYLGYDLNYIRNKIKELSLPKRRLDRFEKKGIIFIHDYAHHPSEIKCLYETITKMYQGRKTIAFFEPHTISRSLRLIEQFKNSLALFDETYILKTFTSVRENENTNIEKFILKKWNYPFLTEKNVLNFDFKPSNIYLFIGAGNIDKLFEKVHII